MADYSQSTILHSCGVQLGATIRKLTVDGSGVTKHLAWWDWEAETWDAEFDAMRHVKPCSRLATDPASPDYKIQAMAIPYKPYADLGTITTIYTLEDGQPKDVWCVEDRLTTATRANLGG